jgi:hypothetical protein
MPGRWLDVAIGLAERRRWHKAAPLLERGLPKRTLQDRVIAYVRDRSRRASILQEHEAPAHRDNLPLAVGGLTHNWGHMTREDCGHRLEGGRAIVRDAEKARHRITFLVE